MSQDDAIARMKNNIIHEMKHMNNVTAYSSNERSSSHKVIIASMSSHISFSIRQSTRKDVLLLNVQMLLHFKKTKFDNVLSNSLPRCGRMITPP